MPVIGSEQGGIRPVLIIQNDVGNCYSPKTKYVFVKKEDPLRPFQYSMLQHRVMQMIILQKEVDTLKKRLDRKEIALLKKL